MKKVLENYGGIVLFYFVIIICSILFTMIVPNNTYSNNNLNVYHLKDK